jgi:hypothetical protein
LCWEKLRAEVVNFPEKYIETSPTWSLGAIVYFNFMIFRIDGFLNVRLVQPFTIDNQIIFVFLDANRLIFVEKLVFLMCIKTVIMIIN